MFFKKKFARLKLQIWIIRFIIALFFQSNATAQQFNYINITNKQGLPSSGVFSILQDKQGYMWFATDHGAARYNGKEFITYTFADGLTDNTILRMCEDHKGRIWFALQSNEICYWENGKIYKIPLSKLLSTTLPGWANIITLYLDASDNIWMNTLFGVYFSDAKQNYTTLIRKEKFKNSNVSFEIIDHKTIIDFKNRNWNAFQKSNEDPYYNFKFAYRIDNKIEYCDTIIPKAQLKQTNNRFEAAFSKDGNLFYSNDFSLFCIHKNKKIDLVKFDHEIIKLTIDRANNLWVSFLKNGVSCFKNGDIHSKPVCVLNDCTVSDVCMDNMSGIWLSTLEKGVFYIPSLGILDYSNIPYLNSPITFLNVINNRVIIATFGEHVLEKKEEEFIPCSFFNTIKTPDLKVLSIRKFNKNIYIIGTNFTVILDESLKQIGPNEPFKTYLKAKDVVKAADNSVWLLNSGSIKQLTCEKEPTVFYNVPYRLTCAIEDKDSRLLVGSKRGLYVFDKGKISWLNEVDPLLKCPITQLMKGAEGAIWVATGGNGLLKLKNNKVTQLSVKDGLTSNICTSLEQDHMGNIWVGTNKGLNRVHFTGSKPTSWEIKNITLKNGLSSNEITKLCIYKDQLWVGSLSGLNSVDISTVSADTIESPTYIQSILVNNQSIDNNQFRFAYDQNSIKINLEGLTYSNDKENRYQFRLLGHRNDWEETKTNELLFNTLQPGDYTFEAKVANRDGRWTRKKVSYHFIINKPFWFTWWFILLEIATTIGLIYLIIYFKTKSITKREEEKSRIHKLLNEYQMKALTAQMNPHFIFNAINSIQNFIMKNHKTIAYEYLEKFSRLIRMVLNNSNENEITLQQELDTLCLYIELEQLRFKDSFDFKLTIDPEIETGEVLTPALLMQPYIENAIWHGLMPLESRRGFISIVIKDNHDSLKISITDNGIGRKTSDQIEKKITDKKHRSMGMELAGKRAVLFGSEQPASITIIDHRDDSNEATGTTVEIILPKIEVY